HRFLFRSVKLVTLVHCIWSLIGISLKIWYKKKSDFGFNGFQVPVIPKAPRSVRRRRSCKKLDDGQICAFELLAAVAGKLLPRAKALLQVMQQKGKMRLLIAGVKALIYCDTAVQEQNLKHGLDKPYHAENNYFLEHISTVIGSDTDMKLENCKEVNIADGKFQTKIEGGSSNLEDPCDNKIRTGTQKHLDDDSKQTEDVTVTNTCSVKTPIEKHVNNNGLFNSDSSVHLPLY
ncbi:hypothetical protein HAX54_025378, partial [Datura stramonium]|nr:hypothetical protein [Datura stramonium]